MLQGSEQGVSTPPLYRQKRMSLRWSAPCLSPQCTDSESPSKLLFPCKRSHYFRLSVSSQRRIGWNSTISFCSSSKSSRTRSHPGSASTFLSIPLTILLYSRWLCCARSFWHRFSSSSFRGGTINSGRTNEQPEIHLWSAVPSANQSHTVSSYYSFIAPGDLLLRERNR